MRKIIHIDMDYFYAQVELIARPEFALKPVAVGGSQHKRGVVATCNYVARQYGIHSAMSMSYALKLCPQLVIFPVDMPKYKNISYQIRQIFTKITHLVEPLSLDEAYLDVTDVKAFQGSATLLAKHLQSEIYQKTGLTCSAGVAANKLLAKIVSNFNKPNGIYTLEPHEVSKFMQTLPIEKLMGVGKVMAKRLNALNIFNCGELQKLSRAELIAQFGKFGDRLYDYARGIDHRPVENQRMRKSISVETTFSLDLAFDDAINHHLHELFKRLEKRLIAIDNDICVKSIFIKITDAYFKKLSFERKTTVMNVDCFQYLIDGVKGKIQAHIRLLGLGVRLQDAKARQLNLFDE